MKNKVYTQLVVWRGVKLNENEVKNFISFFKQDLDTRIKFDSIQFTKPDKCPNGHEQPGTGGRSDIFFYVHKDDINHFATERFRLGSVSWWEDVLGNGQGYLYSDEFLAAHPTTWEYDEGGLIAGLKSKL